MDRKRLPLVLGFLLLLCMLGSAFVVGILGPRQHVHAVGNADWTTYLHDLGHSGFNSAETIVNPASAGSLKQLWSVSLGTLPSKPPDTISSQPVVVNGIIYWGAWDGIERATNLNGQQVWQQNLGTAPTNCGPAIGVPDTATVATETINGAATPVVFVGSASDKLYALNASSGAIIWSTTLGTPSQQVIWDSPILYNGSVYIGIGSNDCPLVQGQVIQLNATTGAVQHTFNVVPNGCIGAGVWGSITIDSSNGTLYFATSTGAQCTQSEPYGDGVVELNASNLTYISSWQVPPAQQGIDLDFGSTPTLFTATLGGSVHHLLGVGNKSGTYCAFDEANIQNGPVWTYQIAVGGTGPIAGDGTISPSAWDGTNLYIGGGKTTINGQPCQGGLRAFNPATGMPVWQQCMTDGPILGAVTVVPGVVAVGEGSAIWLMATTDGHSLFKQWDHSTNSHFYGAPTIANGVVYIGNNDGNFYAYGGLSASTPTPSPSTTALPTPSATASLTPSPTPTPGGAPVSSTWYFAEGKVGQGFTEYITLENPDPVNSCTVNLQYLLTSGSPVTKTVTVNHNSRWTEYVNGDLNTAPNSSTSQTVSTIVTVPAGACKGVVAERPMYFVGFAGVSSGSDVLGATDTAKSFSFADVSTASGYQTFITILNPPGGSVANTTATYSLGGVELGTQALSVEPGTRGTIIPTHFGKDVVAVITSDQPVVMERPTYFSNITAGNASVVSGAASVIGAETLSNDWLFAEGYTGSGFQERLVLANFGTTDISGGSLKLEYDNGTTLSFPVSIAHLNQSIFDINQLTANPGSGTCVTSPRCTTTLNVSIEVSTPTGTGFVAEREMFFHYNNNHGLTAMGDTDITGQVGPATAKAYSFAEGYTNAGYNEWLTLQNPTTSLETISVTLVNQLGRTYTAAFLVGAQSRFTVDITGLVTHNLVQPGDGYQGYEVSMTAQSTTGVFVAERPMYWNASGTQGGSNILGYIGN